MIDGIQNNLPRILFDRGLNAANLAEITGIPYTTIYNIVEGRKRGIKFRQMAIICRALGVDTGDVWPLSEVNE